MSKPIYKPRAERQKPPPPPPPPDATGLLAHRQHWDIMALIGEKHEAEAALTLACHRLQDTSQFLVETTNRLRALEAAHAQTMQRLRATEDALAQNTCLLAQTTERLRATEAAHKQSVLAIHAACTRELREVESSHPAHDV